MSRSGSDDSDIEEVGIVIKENGNKFAVDSSSTDTDTPERPTGAGVVLDESRKSVLVDDLASICDIEKEAARAALEANNWDMQTAIDKLWGLGDDDDEVVADKSESEENSRENSDEVEMIEVPENSSSTVPEPASPGPSSTSAIAAAVAATILSPPRECSKELDVETENSGPLTPGGTNYSTWAPEKFSIISWNVDGLDDKNLEKRMACVVDLIKKEQHGVVFLQELLPHTFEYIARRLSPEYHPIVGTENPNSEYFTATFLRNYQVIYEDHFIVPYPGTAMDRNMLVTKAFIGRAKLVLLNTHLESTADFAAERTSQLKQCFQLCASFPQEYNVIFGGDLNLRDKEVAGNLSPNFSDLWIKCGSRKTCEYTWDLTRNKNKQMPSKWQPRLRFDRLYFRESVPKTIGAEFFGLTGIEKVAGTQSFPSDHWAIMSFFRLEKEARRPYPKKRKAED